MIPKDEPKKPWREFWMLGKDVIKNTCIAYMDKPKGPDIQYYVHVIEHAALAEAQKEIDELRGWCNRFVNTLMDIGYLPESEAELRRKTIAAYEKFKVEK